MLFYIYMKLLREVIRRCGLWNHQYADDTQLYLSFFTNPSEAVAVLNRCLGELEQAVRVDEEGSTMFLQLRQQFKEDEKAYKRKLQAFQDGQQHQAQLVQKMQNKMLQYKKRCGELEQQLLEKTSECEHQKQMLQTRLDSTEMRLRRFEHDHSVELESTLLHLGEEQKRNTSLSQMNTLLREQLDQMKSSKQRLAGELEKAAADVHRLRSELEQKESHRHKSRESYPSYLGSEHSGILLLWRQAAALRGNFAELRTTVERGIAEAGTDMARVAHRLHTACLNLDSNLRLSESSSACLLEKQLREKVREMIQLQSRWDGEKAELNSRITELTTLGDKLKEQNAKKEKTISTLKMDIQKLEASKTGDLEETKDLKEEIESLQHSLNSITKLALSECRSPGFITLESAKAASEEDTIWQTSPLRSSSPHHPWTSPSWVHSPTCQKAALQAVQAAFQKYRQHEQELNVQLETCRDALGSVKKQLSDCQQETKEAKQRLQEQRQKSEGLTQMLEDCKRELQRWKSSVEDLGREKGALEVAAEKLTQQLDSSHLEVEWLKTTNGDLQRQRKLLEEQKEDVIKERERTRKELERGQRSLEQLEERMSALKKELVTVKESLNQAMLEKDVLESAKEDLSGALSKIEATNAELERSIYKMKLEDAELRDSLAKMGALNEGLAHDKVSLNRIILQLEDEKSRLLSQKRELEQEQAVSREQLAHSEQELMHMKAEKCRLEESCQASEDKQERLEGEMAFLRRERVHLQDQIMQLNSQKQTLGEQLAQSHQEMEMQADSLLRVLQEKEEIAKEKAQLAVELTALERHRKLLAEEGDTLRVEKESLETSLFEAQELVAQLEARKEQLEGENQSIDNSKKTLQAELGKALHELELQETLLRKEIEMWKLQLTQMEEECQQTIKKQKLSFEADLECLRKEKMFLADTGDKRVARKILPVHNTSLPDNNLLCSHQEVLRLTLTEEKEKTMHHFQQEKEELVAKSEAEKRDLMDEILTLQQNREESLLLLENEKQKVRRTEVKGGHFLGGESYFAPVCLSRMPTRSLHCGNLLVELSESRLPKFPLLPSW
ncbi:putative ciliary rootlet coiled-coil protein 2 [Varanus komodoensis]|nr:putative ciliary rootlet coiled-coil protein 2 [Varanus komodoensis]